MQTFFKFFLIFACLAFISCSTKPQGIEEISLTAGGRDYKGDGHFSGIKFRRDGRAEKSEQTFVHDTIITSQSQSRGKISDEQFEKLADLLTAKGFFSTEDKGFTTDSSEYINVVYSKGEKHLSTHNNDNSGISAIADAVRQTAQKIEWEKVD